MYKQHLVQVDNWRNFVSEAPDFRLRAYTGLPLFIDLKDIIVQGAVDLVIAPEDPGAPTVSDEQLSPLPLTDILGEAITGRYTLDNKPSQRGWLLNYSLVGQPVNGTSEKDRNLQGMVYTSYTTFQGEDCFNYQFSNGTQPSNYGKVTVDVERFYDIDMSIVEEWPGQYKFTGSIYSPPDLGAPKFFTIEWHVVSPEVAIENGEPVVSNQDQLVKKTEYTFNPFTEELVVVDNGLVTDLMTLTDDSDLQGYDPNTGVIYNSTKKLPTVYTLLTVYPFELEPGVVDYSRSFEIRTDVRTQYTEDWWENGLIDRPYLDLPPASIAENTQVRTGYMIGEEEVTESESVQLSLRTFYADQTGSTITSDATWSIDGQVEGEEAATVVNGLVTPNPLTSDKTITVRAVYSYGGRTVQDTLRVKLINESEPVE